MKYRRVPLNQQTLLYSALYSVLLAWAPSRFIPHVCSPSFWICILIRFSSFWWIIPFISQQVYLPTQVILRFDSLLIYAMISMTTSGLLWPNNNIHPTVQSVQLSLPLSISRAIAWTSASPSPFIPHPNLPVVTLSMVVILHIIKRSCQHSHALIGSLVN